MTTLASRARRALVFLALAFLALGVGSATARADVRLPRILSDGVVLQRERIVALFGRADPGEEVRVRASWGASSEPVYADGDGAWIAYVRTPVAGGPHTLEVAGRNRVVVRDVWSGEVWLCSGQSNMEMPLAPSPGGYGGTLDWEREVAAARVPGLHLFTVANRASSVPLDDVAGSWAAADPKSAAGFSAVAYHAGATLARELGVPVGLVAADWGGTPIESWTSGVTLRNVPEFADEIERLEREARAPVAAAEARARELDAWLEGIEEVDHGLRDGCAAAELDDAAWAAVTVPGALAGEFADHDGVVWLRRAFDVPADLASTPGEWVLELGAIDDEDVTWLDGARVGTTAEPGAWNRPRAYRLAAPLAPGRHVLAVRVLDTGGAAGIVSAAATAPTPRLVAGTRALALGGTWRARRGAALRLLAPRPTRIETGAWTPSALWNGMIAPLTRCSFRGVFWYQGESNRPRAWAYREGLPALVRDWRARFRDEDLVFGIVQIAPFDYAGDVGEAFELREAQRLAAETLARTGLVVTSDVGDVGDIHPRDKTTVGRRLAAVALARAYGRDVPAAGPAPAAVVERTRAADGLVRLVLRCANARGLAFVSGTRARIELGDATGRLATATARVEEDRLVLEARGIGDVVRVRAGTGATDDAFLVNADGWPASSFRLRVAGERLEPDDEGWVTRRGERAPHWRRSGDLLTLPGPIRRADEGVPLGNGTLGALVWGDTGVLRVTLDRSDLWDLRPAEATQASDWTWSTLRRLVAAGDVATIRRRFDAPYDDVPYPTKLPLARFELPLRGATPRAFTLDVSQGEARVALSSGSVRAFVSAARPVALLRVEGVDVPSAWSAQALFVANGAAALGVDVVERRDGERRAGLEFAGPGGVRHAIAAVGVERAGGLEVALAVTTSAHSSAPLDEALRWADAALAFGYAPLLGESMALTRVVRGPARVTTGDEALDVHYEIAAHLFASGSRRGAPPLGLQGPWTDDASPPPWKGDYHADLNAQATYGAYATAGQFDGGLAWLEHLARLRPRWREFARSFYGVDGAVVPGVFALDGAPLGGWCMYALSPTHSGWIAWQFARHWRYTGDEVFLRDVALPFVTEVADALLALAPPDTEGRRRLPLSSSPEIHDDTLRAWLAPNSNYDLAALRAGVASAAELCRVAGRRADAERYEAALAQFEPFDVGADGALTYARGEPAHESHRHFSHALAIHPLGLVSIEGGARERALVDATLDGILASGTSNWCGYSFAWYAAMTARAGRPETARRFLLDYERAFTLGNGFHANGDQIGAGLSNFTYRPVTLEGNFLAMEALHEMLLQSWGGVVRVFPAASRAWSDAAFEKLRAEGGWIVSARRVGGVTAEVVVEATRDGVLRLRDPFPGANVAWSRSEVTREGPDWVVRLVHGEILVGTRAAEARAGAGAPKR